jgi:hypothetical protein
MRQLLDSEMGVDHLKLYVIIFECHPNEAAATRALTWLEHTFPALEPACYEMRESFLSKDSETLKWSSSFAFNATIIELSLSQQTLATSQRNELSQSVFRFKPS